MAPKPLLGVCSQSLDFFRKTFAMYLYVSNHINVNLIVFFHVLCDYMVECIAAGSEEKQIKG